VARLKEGAVGTSAMALLTFGLYGQGL